MKSMSVYIAVLLISLTSTCFAIEVNRCEIKSKSDKPSCRNKLTSLEILRKFKSAGVPNLEIEDFSPYKPILLTLNSIHKAFTGNAANEYFEYTLDNFLYWYQQNYKNWKDYYPNSIREFMYLMHNTNYKAGVTVDVITTHYVELLKTNYGDTYYTIREFDLLKGPLLPRSNPNLDQFKYFHQLYHLFFDDKDIEPDTKLDFIEKFMAIFQHRGFNRSVLSPSGIKKQLAKLQELRSVGPDRAKYRSESARNFYNLEAFSFLLESLPATKNSENRDKLLAERTDKFIELFNKYGILQAIRGIVIIYDLSDSFYRYLLPGSM
jgi:hypothetical protein